MLGFPRQPNLPTGMPGQGIHHRRPPISSTACCNSSPHRNLRAPPRAAPALAEAVNDSYTGDKANIDYVVEALRHYGKDFLLDEIGDEEDGLKQIFSSASDTPAKSPCDTPARGRSVTVNTARSASTSTRPGDPGEHHNALPAALLAAPENSAAACSWPTQPR
jgi:hypothetical protein